MLRICGKKPKQSPRKRPPGEREREREREREGSSTEEIRKSFHELRVHQIELELQNEELRQAQAELEESQARYFDLYDLAPVGYCTLSEQGLILEANLTAATLLGETRAMLVKQPISRFIHKEDQDIYYLHRKEVFKTGAPQECELRLDKPDVSLIWARLSTTSAQAKDGVPVCRCVMSDITDRKRVEERLADSEQRYRTIADFTYDWEFWVAPDGNFVYVSPSCEKVTGYTADEFMQDTGLMGRITHPEDHGKVICFNVEQSEPLYYEHREYDFRIVTRTGKTTYISHCCQPVFSKDGRFMGRRGSNRDITERKRAEEAIKQANQQLQRTNAEKDKLFSIIAHDLKSPMCGLLGSTEMLANQAEIFSEQEIRRLSSELHKSAKNAFALLEDLLQWSRMSQGGIDYAPSPCSLNELINMGLYSAKDIAKRKDVAIHNNIPSGLTVIVDQPMLKTVIRNILFNAIKFSERGGDIVINAHQDEQVATVAIADNGIGMNQSTLSSIFSFEKAKRQLGTEGEKGTGLGLVLCKQFIEQHGGQIWVESEPGKGTTVYFRLFRAESSPG